MTIWQILIVVLCIGFAVQTVMLLALLRYLGALVRRMPRAGLPIGEPAPRRTIIDTLGRRIVLGRPSPMPRLVVFLEPDCPACVQLTPAVGALAKRLADSVEIIVVTDQIGEDEAARMYERLGAGDAIRLVDSPSLSDSYLVPGTPYGVAIDPEGVVREGNFVAVEADLHKLAESARPTPAAPESSAPRRSTEKIVATEPIGADVSS